MEGGVCAASTAHFGAKRTRPHRIRSCLCADARAAAARGRGTAAQASASVTATTRAGALASAIQPLLLLLRLRLCQLRLRSRASSAARSPLLMVAGDGVGRVRRQALGLLSVKPKHKEMTLIEGGGGERRGKKEQQEGGNPIDLKTTRNLAPSPPQSPHTAPTLDHINPPPHRTATISRRSEHCAQKFERALHHTSSSRLSFTRA